jgi:ADP-heptose:LPS heptosyltransferase
MSRLLSLIGMPSPKLLAVLDVLRALMQITVGEHVVLVAPVSALRAMVCVDSGFLHPAGAFDVPVIAIFGPTDGKLFTRHHRRATVISTKESFACAPCRRNEGTCCVS